MLVLLCLVAALAFFALGAAKLLTRIDPLLAGLACLTLAIILGGHL